MRRLYYELFESIRIAFAQIWANKLRSTLTALGVIIGIVAVTLMGTAIKGIDAGVVEGRKVTSDPSIQADLKNAGAQWVDEPVVVDNGLVTSRRPSDIPAFNRKMIEEIEEGPHGPRGQTAKRTEREFSRFE